MPFHSATAPQRPTGQTQRHSAQRAVQRHSAQRAITALQRHSATALNSDLKQMQELLAKSVAGWGMP